ncbi:sensor histidine kinase [Glaciibacter flavus]|uniref:sensor histidine kinase n=1 Tax=Orlajensenia flava TaxID=2565934 RepID=UPI003AFF7BE4
MALGLPDHLADDTLNRALARAAHLFGSVCLIGALVAAIALSAARPTEALWPTVIALVPMGLLLATLATNRTSLAATGYLVIGGLSSFVYTVTIFGDRTAFPSSSMLIVALPAMALVMVGATGVGSARGVLWATGGLLVGEGAIIAACLVTGQTYRLDWFVPLTYLFLVSVLFLEAVNRRVNRAAQPSILRAARDNNAFALRRDLEARATSLMHDTVLSHLISIAAAGPGPIDPRMRSLVSRDLDRLVGGDWLVSQEAAYAASAQEWAATPLADSIDAVRLGGLRVDVAGDRQVVAILPSDIAAALGLAVRQCLANVERHAGVDRVEIAIMATDGEVSVMVADAGAGFTPTEQTSHIGLRHSIRQRIVDVGGEVQVWSSPGEGTSVMLTVPRTTVLRTGTASVAAITGVHPGGAGSITGPLDAGDARQDVGL